MPGVLRTRHREQPGCAGLPGRAHRRRLARQRPEGLDQPGPVRRPLCPAHPDGHRRSPPTGASPPCSWTWTPPGSRCGRSAPCTAAPSSPSCSSTTSSSPLERTLGDEGGGWAVAMDLLPYERSTSLWHRAAFLHRRLQELLEAAPPGALDPTRLGEVTQLLYAFRARSRATQHRMAAGDRLGPETSVDKVLLATIEQAVFDLVADALAPAVTVGDDPVSGRWRTEYLYSRRRLHLRRQRRDPAQHHRPPPPRPRGRPVMDDDDLALFARSLRDAADRQSGPDRGPSLDLALDDLGWDDALDDDPRAAVSALFGAQGETAVTSSALARVLAHALGLSDPPGTWATTVIPAAGTSTPPGTRRGRPDPGGRPGGGRTRRAGIGPDHRHIDGRDRRRPFRPDRRPRTRDGGGRRPGAGPAAGDRRRSGRRRRGRPPAGSLGRRRQPRAPGPLPRAGRLFHGDAGPGPRARPGPRPVRSPHRQLPGRPPPSGRDPGGRRDGLRHAGRRLAGPRHPP